MTPCKVKWYGPCLLVTFPNGKTLLIQGEDDIASFTDGREPAFITECSDEYLALAE